MAYQRRILSDGTAIDLGTEASVTSGGATSDVLDTRNYAYVDFIVKVNSKGSATSLSLTVDFSTLSSGGSSDWANLTSEAITSGTAPQSDYQATYSLADFSGAFTIGLSVPTRARYMRVSIEPDDTISGVTFSAIRRI